MDGSPSRGETIPIRLFLGGFDLTPTFREVNKKYSTRYYLSLVLIDEGKSSLCWPSREYMVDENRRCTEILQTIRDSPLPPTTGDCSSSRPADTDHGRTSPRTPAAYRPAHACLIYI